MFLQLRACQSLGFRGVQGAVSRFVLGLGFEGFKGCLGFRGVQGLGLGLLGFGV